MEGSEDDGVHALFQEAARKMQEAKRAALERVQAEHRAEIQRLQAGWEHERADLLRQISGPQSRSPSFYKQPAPLAISPNPLSTIPSSTTTSSTTQDLLPLQDFQKLQATHARLEQKYAALLAAAEKTTQSYEHAKAVWREFKQACHLLMNERPELRRALKEKIEEIRAKDAVAKDGLAGKAGGTGPKTNRDEAYNPRRMLSQPVGKGKSRTGQAVSLSPAVKSMRSPGNRSASSASSRPSQSSGTSSVRSSSQVSRASSSLDPADMLRTPQKSKVKRPLADITGSPSQAQAAASGSTSSSARRNRATVHSAQKAKSLPYIKVDLEHEIRQAELQAELDRLSEETLKHAKDVEMLQVHEAESVFHPNDFLASEASYTHRVLLAEKDAGANGAAICMDGNEVVLEDETDEEDDFEDWEDIDDANERMATEDDELRASPSPIKPRRSTVSPTHKSPWRTYEPRGSEPMRSPGLTEVDASLRLKEAQTQSHHASPRAAGRKSYSSYSAHSESASALGSAPYAGTTRLGGALPGTAPAGSSGMPCIYPLPKEAYFVPSPGREIIEESLPPKVSKKAALAELASFQTAPAERPAATTLLERPGREALSNQRDAYLDTPALQIGEAPEKLGDTPKQARVGSSPSTGNEAKFGKIPQLVSGAQFLDASRALPEKAAKGIMPELRPVDSYRRSPRAAKVAALKLLSPRKDREPSKATPASILKGKGKERAVEKEEQEEEESVGAPRQQDEQLKQKNDFSGHSPGQDYEQDDDYLDDGLDGSINTKIQWGGYQRRGQPLPQLSTQAVLARAGSVGIAASDETLMTKLHDSVSREDSEESTEDSPMISDADLNNASQVAELRSILLTSKASPQTATSQTVQEPSATISGEAPPSVGGSRITFELPIIERDIRKSEHTSAKSGSYGKSKIANPDDFAKKTLSSETLGSAAPGDRRASLAVALSGLDSFESLATRPKALRLSSGAPGSTKCNDALAADSTADTKLAPPEESQKVESPLPSHNLQDKGRSVRAASPSTWFNAAAKKKKEGGSFTAGLNSAKDGKLDDELPTHVKTEGSGTPNDSLFFGKSGATVAAAKRVVDLQAEEGVAPRAAKKSRVGHQTPPHGRPAASRAVASGLPTISGESSIPSSSSKLSQHTPATGKKVKKSKDSVSEELRRELDEVGDLILKKAHGPQISPAVRTSHPNKQHQSKTSSARSTQASREALVTPDHMAASSSKRKYKGTDSGYASSKRPKRRSSTVADDSDERGGRVRSGQEAAAEKGDSRGESFFRDIKRKRKEDVKDNPLKHRGHGLYAKQMKGSDDEDETIRQAVPSKEVIRDKELRAQMHGVDCNCCRGYYEYKTRHLPLEERAEAERQMKQAASRHREHIPPPQSPPGYWDMGFPDSPEVDKINKQAKLQSAARKREKMAIAAEHCDGG